MPNREEKTNEDRAEAGDSTGGGGGVVHSFRERQLVKYHPIAGEPDDGVIYKIIYLGSLHRTKVAWLDKKRACVAVANLSPWPYECDGVNCPARAHDHYPGE